ncbi:MAG: hypothetical protein M3Y24_04670 [Acidobacteriota bacterium]|nr:hypothetical protein [Acidobacteriota bacterium]
MSCSGPANLDLNGEQQAAVCATALLDILEACLHARSSEWIFLRELRLGRGTRNNFAQRLDGFALNCLPHLAMKRVCYEVKTSRADFFCELRQPLKRRMGLRYSNEFYFVTPPGLVELSEIPVECGLIEAGPTLPDSWRTLSEKHAGFFHFDAQTKGFCVIKLPAPWRDTPAPTWQFAAAMLRNQSRQLKERPPAPPKQQRLEL